MLYACRTCGDHRLASLNAPLPTYMPRRRSERQLRARIGDRRTGVAANLDHRIAPAQLCRDRPHEDKPFSSKIAAANAMPNGAARFGWGRRSPEPGLDARRRGADRLGHGERDHPMNRRRPVPSRLRPRRTVAVQSGTHPPSSGAACSRSGRRICQFGGKGRRCRCRRCRCRRRSSEAGARRRRGMQQPPCRCPGRAIGTAWCTPFNPRTLVACTERYARPRRCRRRFLSGRRRGPLMKHSCDRLSSRMSQRTSRRTPRLRECGRRAALAVTVSFVLRGVGVGVIDAPLASTVRTAPSTSGDIVGHRAPPPLPVARTASGRP